MCHLCVSIIYLLQRGRIYQTNGKLVTRYSILNPVTLTFTETGFLCTLRTVTQQRPVWLAFTVPFCHDIRLYALHFRRMKILCGNPAKTWFNFLKCPWIPEVLLLKKKKKKGSIKRLTTAFVVKRLSQSKLLQQVFARVNRGLSKVLALTFKEKTDANKRKNTEVLMAGPKRKEVYQWTAVAAQRSNLYKQLLEVQGSTQPSSDSAEGVKILEQHSREK